VKITRDGGYPAARTPMSVPGDCRDRSAVQGLGGSDLLLVPALGGSLPLHPFTERLRKPALVVPIANHDNNQHAADKNLRVARICGMGLNCLARC
jgi:hypothetical protein